MADWKKIKAEYVRDTSASLRSLAEKHGVSFSSIQKKSASEKWTDLRKKSCKKAEEKIVESAATAQAKQADKVQMVADMLLDMIIDTIQGGIIDISAKRGFRDITGALKDIREIKGYKSDLDLQEQMARIEKLRKEAQEESQESKDIKVIISGDLENYAK